MRKWNWWDSPALIIAQWKGQQKELLEIFQHKNSTWIAICKWFYLYNMIHFQVKQDVQWEKCSFSSQHFHRPSDCSGFEMFLIEMNQGWGVIPIWIRFVMIHWYSTWHLYIQNKINFKGYHEKSLKISSYHNTLSCVRYHLSVCVSVGGLWTAHWLISVPIPVGGYLGEIWSLGVWTEPRMEEYTSALPSTHKEQFLAEERASSLHVSHRLCVSMLY